MARFRAIEAELRWTLDARRFACRGCRRRVVSSARMKSDTPSSRQITLSAVDHDRVSQQA
jgi:hypothetical protein